MGRLRRWSTICAAWLAAFAGVAVADAPVRQVAVLAADAGEASAEVIVSGALDTRFEAFDLAAARRRGGSFWLRLEGLHAPTEAGVATLNVRKGRHLRVQPYVQQGGGALPLRLATEAPGFRGVHEAVFMLPQGEHPARLYVHVEPTGSGFEDLHFSAATLDRSLAQAAGHARMIAWTFGALAAMSLAALLIWLVLSDRLVLLYSSLFGMQALYMAYLSGQGFEWPVFAALAPLGSYTWNVPAALTGGIACLFVREIAELKRFSPRVYRIFGVLAVVFFALAAANVAQHVGLGRFVSTFGNLLFVGTAVFTLIVAFLAWRRQNRAAGWFLIAWGLLETFTIATALRLLVADAEASAGLLYYGLPLSMVAAAVLIALGVADRLRDQRRALSDAERRAQTDPLTGVLNRRSLVERLEAACLRAQARGLPIGLLFIDLDHFKQINDVYGHAAGDACLKAVIEPIQAELRQSDVIGRYGGEEFVVILSSADAAAAEPIAERIRHRVADVRVHGFGAPIHVTCSIGVATSDALNVWGEKLIARADEAVYAAKRSGRNRVRIAAPPLAA